jgi:hypothetical protein
LSRVHLCFDIELAAALFLEARSLESESPIGIYTIIDLIRLEASDGTSLIATSVNTDFFKEITIGSIDRSNSLSVINDHLAQGVLVGVRNTAKNVFSSTDDSFACLVSQLLENSEDGVAEIICLIKIVVDSDIVSHGIGGSLGLDESDQSNSR